MKKIGLLEYNSLIWFIIRASFVELTSYLLISEVKQDAWLAVLIGIFIGIIPVSLMLYFKNKYPNDNIISLNNKLGFIGKIINIILLISVFIFGLTSFWVLIHFINSIVLFNTSLWIIIIAFIIPIWYISSKDIHVIGKTGLLMFYAMIAFIFIILIGLANNIEFDNLMPVFNHKTSKILYASLIFVSFDILPLFLLSIIPKDKVKNYSNKASLISYILASLSVLNIIFLIISCLGIDLASLYEYPGYHLLKRVSLLDIVDRLENVLSLEWLFSTIIQVVITIHFITQGIKEMFKSKEKTNNYITIIICLSFAIISNFIFKTHGTETVFFKNILLYILIGSFFILPLISLICSHFINHNKSQRNNNCNN